MEQPQVYLTGITASEFIDKIAEKITPSRLSISHKPKKKYLNIKELSELTGYSLSTIYRMTSERRIPFIKLGKNLLFDDEDIRNWLDSKKKNIIK